jgi:hypothetical protein
MANNKPKKISITTLEKTMADYVPTTTFEWRGIEITVNKTLSLEDMMLFVNNVTSLCFRESDGEYLPEIKDCVIKSCIVELYTNLTLPSNISRKYDLLYRTDVINAIVEHINQVQFREIIDAIDCKIDNVAQANIEVTNRQITELYTTFNSLQERIEGIFSGVTQEDLVNLVSAMGNGAIDEEKLVQAYKKSHKLVDGE